jgi:serine/threonine protein kinase
MASPPEPWSLDGLGELRNWELISNLPTSQVWTAVEGSPGRRIAVKLVPIADGTDAERFRRESGALMELSTKNGIVTLYGFRLLPDQHVGWLKLEFCSGGSLQNHLDRFGPLNPAIAGRHLVSVTDALLATHSKHRIHCDVKPANILIDEHGDAKLADFGIARRLTAFGDDNPDITDQVEGFTPGFVPPEQAELDQQQPKSSIFHPPESGLAIESERTTKYDVWLVATTYVALTTGTPPLRGASPATTRSRLRSVGVDDPLLDVLMRALAANPLDRPTMEELHTTLTAAQQRGLGASNDHRPRRNRRRARVAAGVLVLVGAGWLVIALNSDERQATTSTSSPQSSMSVAPPDPTSPAAPTSSASADATTIPDAARPSTVRADLRVLDAGPAAGQDPAAAADETGLLVVYSRFSDLTTQMGSCSADCTDFENRTIEVLGTSANYPRVALHDGLPIIAAVDSAAGGVVIVLCLDRLCERAERRDVPISADGQAATRALSPRPSPEEQLIALHVDVAIGSEGRPIVVFDDPATKAVTLLLCDDARCATWQTRVAGVGVWPKVAVGSDGLPIVVYSSDSLAGPLTLFRCSDQQCLTSQQRSFDTVGMRPTIATAGEQVFIAGLDFTQPAIKVVVCSDLQCDEAVVSSLAIGLSYPTLQVTSNGTEVHLAYFEEATQRSVVQSCSWPCATLTRTAVDGPRFELADTSGPFDPPDFGHDPAPVLDPSGRLIVFGNLIPSDSPTRGLGAVVSRGAGCGEEALCPS